MADVGFWARHIFTLISSDAVRRNVHGKMLERLRKEGFQPIAAGIIDAYPELIDNLYADLIAGQWKTWRYRMVDAVFALGPAMGVIVRYDGGHEDPHSLLAERKGYQHPEQAAEGTLRRDFGSINTVVGIMHSSDSPADSERESEIFGVFPDQFADRPGDAAAEIDYLCRLCAPAAPETRDFDSVLGGMRMRVVAASWESLSVATRHQLQDRFPLRSDLGQVGVGADLADLLKNFCSEEVAEVLRCEFEPEWHDRLRIGQAEKALRGLGVALDQWERVVLESSLHFPPRRFSRSAPPVRSA